MASGLGTVTIDFGATPASEASVAVTGLTDIPADAMVEAWIMGRSTVDNGVADHQFGALAMRFVCSEPIAGVGFTITAYCLMGFATGTFKLEWIWGNL